MKTKTGQADGSPAATLIIIIAGFILVYILLLPSGDRDELLGNHDSKTSLNDKERKFGLLLNEQPGTITKLKEREFEHRIPSFNLFEQQEDAILKRVDSVFIDSADNPVRSVPLFADKKTKNGRLALAVNDHKGRLTIRFNDDEIFKGEINSLIDPLSLDSIREENVIEFSVESVPGWKFWEKNFYDIRDIRVSGTIENSENLEAVNTFFITKEEADKDNIETAFMIYLVDCDVRQSGRLTVTLNGNFISSKNPDCGSLEKTFIDPDDFVEGKNEVRFSTERGKFLIDQVFIKTKLDKPIFKVYFFDLNETQFKNVDNNTINSTMHLEFVRDTERKTAIIHVNEHRIFLDTREDEFTKNIDPFVVEGSNSVRIEPEKTLHVLSLKVELDCQNQDDCS